MSVVSDRLLFIHIPKTGGMSCREWLASNVAGAVHPLDDDARLKKIHIPLRDVPALTGRSLDSWDRVVAVIRDPYAQQLSMWMHQREEYAKGGRHPLQIAAAGKPDIESWLRDVACDERFWYETEKGGLTNASYINAVNLINACGYYEYWLTVDGSLPPNLVLLPFDDMPGCFIGACAPYLVPSPSAFPHHNSSRGRNPREYFSSFARRLLEHKFRWVFGGGIFETWR